jgi:predicted alpha/beta hydrolase family esterase
VCGALLVAPSDPERPGAPREVASFAPLPRGAALPYPSLLVASANDAICSPQRAAELAAAWGSELRVAGALGHINADSGLGDWPQGQQLLHELQLRAAGTSELAQA